MTQDNSGPVPTEHGEGEHPRGALFLTLVFLIAMVAMWGYIFMQMLRAG